MAKYASVSDIRDSTVEVLEEDLLAADNFVDNLLLQMGINPSSISLPNETLKEVAVLYATYLACIREARGENTVYIEKAKLYEKLYKEKAKQVSPRTLGVSSEWSSMRLGRA